MCITPFHSARCQCFRPCLTQEWTQSEREILEEPEDYSQRIEIWASCEATDAKSADAKKKTSDGVISSQQALTKRKRGQNAR